MTVLSGNAQTALAPRRNTQSLVSATENPGGGIKDFELIYYNNASGGHMNLQMDETFVTPASSAVPLPAAFPVLLGALGVMGGAALRRRRKYEV